MTPRQQADVAIARAILTNMPNEVFDIYIQPLILSNGWPFRSLNSPTLPPWLLYFDHHSIQTIGKLRWERHTMYFLLGLFHSSSQQRIVGIIDTHIRGLSTPFANITNGRQRFFRPRAYIARTGRMPVPVILMQDFGGLRILDGNHRLAALASLRNANSIVVDCWIGSL